MDNWRKPILSCNYISKVEFGDLLNLTFILVVVVKNISIQSHHSGSVLHLLSLVALEQAKST